MIAIGNSVRCGSIALFIILSLASRVGAQNIVDARRVEFTPSTDHNVLDNGVALVDRYSLQVFVAGGATPTHTADLGKPTPEADGKIRLDFVALLGSPLTPGVTYEALVEAVGPGGSSGGTRSNTFSFTPPCAPSISPASQSLTAAAGTGSSNVTAGAGCAWTAASNAPSWISITSGATGSGNGTVGFSVAANPATASRTGTLTIAGATFTVNQAASCSFSISPASQSVASTASSGTVTVTTGSGCPWTATSGVSWVTISSGATGTGNGTAGFAVAANTGTAQRSTVLTIAGKSFTVTQAAPCTFTASPMAATFASTSGTGTVAVTTQAACTWSSSTTTAWITVTGSGPGNGSASYTVAANTGTTVRTGTLTVAGQIVTVTQGVKPAAPTNLRIVR